MKRVAVLLSAIYLIFSSSAAFSEPDIEKSKNALYIKSEENTYVYYFKTKRADFMTVLKGPDAFGASIATLDKKDKPQNITAIMVRGGTLVRQEFPKSDKTNATLYENVEALVKSFIQEHDVKKIIARHEKHK